MGRLILVLGGARSGKSAFAQQLASELGGNEVLFVATAVAGDEEMQQRIDRHRRERPAGWRTAEARRAVGEVILGEARGAKAVLLDCLTMLVANPLMDAEASLAADVEAAVIGEVEGVLSCAERLPGDLIVVSNEVGMGLVPPYPVGRAYRDLLGQANQIMARQAHEVYLLIAGVPLLIKDQRR